MFVNYYVIKEIDVIYLSIDQVIITKFAQWSTVT